VNDKMVHVWQLKCWNCMLLHKDFAQNTHTCPQNVFRDSELYREYFGCKCSMFESIKEHTMVR
jgi:hypothetical protein